MNYDPFKEYIRQSEPDKRYRGYAWRTAIGLQGVDGLEPSKYLINTAIKNIEGEITIEEAQHLMDTYYEENPKLSEGDRTEEADKVAVRITKILSENAFSFTTNEYISIHRRLFEGIYAHAGKMRDYNITKKEWVLNGATVLYGSASELRATLEYDFSEEKKFSYQGLTMDEIMHHLAVFVSRLWQIHVFFEGNTRTTAVFFIKYLRTLGFEATNDIFAEKSWYFRNALVRANYNDLKNGIHETTEFLELFLRNLLLGEQNELHNRAMHISGKFADYKNANIIAENVDIKLGKANIGSKKANIGSKKANIGSKKANIGNEKANIGSEKADIGSEKANIGNGKTDIGSEKANIGSRKANIGSEKANIGNEKADVGSKKANIGAEKADIAVRKSGNDGEYMYIEISKKCSAKTYAYILKIYEAYNKKIFGRTDVQAVTGLKPTRTSELLKELSNAKVIEPVSGHGKGKYRFVKTSREEEK